MSSPLQVVQGFGFIQQKLLRIWPRRSVHMYQVFTWIILGECATRIILGECATIHSPPALFFFFFLSRNLLTRLISLFRPRSVDSGTASWYDCCQVFPDKLHASSFLDMFPRCAWTVAWSAHSNFIACKVVVIVADSGLCCCVPCHTCDVCWVLLTLFMCCFSGK